MLIPAGAKVTLEWVPKQWTEVNVQHGVGLTGFGRHLPCGNFGKVDVPPRTTIQNKDGTLESIWSVLTTHMRLPST